MNAHLGLDERYLTWLCDMVGMNDGRNPEKTFLLLAAQMHQVAFDDSTPNDHNRALDGQDLRREFSEQTGVPLANDWLDLDCSMLEMILALSRRLTLHTDWSLRDAFWRLMYNIELDKYHDDRYHDGVADAVDYTMRTINDRTYGHNGRGGLFPLRESPVDQRGVEIWYQMSAYLQENYTF